MDLCVLSYLLNEPECFCHNEMKYVALIIAMSDLLIVVFWGLMLGCLVGGYQCSEGVYHFRKFDNSPEDGGDRFLLNTGNHLQDYMASQH
jgi:hypothetical protein